MIKPQPKQEEFLKTSADIAIYGGSAGGGKTFALLLEQLRHINVKDFGSVIFRRTSPQITAQGGLWDESTKLYTLCNAKPSISERTWTFEQKTKVKFSHLQHDKNMYSWQGSQIPLISFDELTHFTSDQFWYLLSRNRSTCGIKPYIRATCNPLADSWVADLISWYIDQETGYIDENKSGKIRYFIRDNETLLWADDKRDLTTNNIEPKSFTFISASIYDNAILMEKDPTYLSNLQSQSLVERERLLHGNWKIKPTSGTIFDKSWVKIVDAVPNEGLTVRFWDFAASEKTLKKKNPDYTASVLMRYVKGAWYILDCNAVRISPAEIDMMVVNLAEQDNYFSIEANSKYKVRWELEPASAGIRENVRLVSMLNKYDASGIRPQGDKITRFMPFAAQAKVGNVFLLKGSFNELWLNHLHNQPNLDHDDIMDSTSGAYYATIAGNVQQLPSAYR